MIRSIVDLADLSSRGEGRKDRKPQLALGCAFPDEIRENKKGTLLLMGSIGAP